MMKGKQISVEYLLPLIFLAASFLYLGWQGWRALRPWIGPKGQFLYWFLFIGLNAFPILLQLLGHNFSQTMINWATKIQFQQFLFFIYLLMLTIILHVSSWFAIRILGWHSLEQPIWSLLALLFALTTVTAVLSYGRKVAQTLYTTPYEITLQAEVPQEKTYRLAVVSDLHLGYIQDRAHLQKMVDAILATQPDLILVAGDILHQLYKPFREQNMAVEWARLHAPLGVYAVLGNHDAYSGKSNLLMEELTVAGVTMAQDQSFVIDNQFVLVGRRDKGGVGSSEATKRRTLQELLTGKPENLPVVVLDHQPTRLIETSQNGLVDLMLSGHTHAGQFWPATWITKLIYEINYGHRQIGNTHVIVTSGIGTWGPDFRLGSISEIALVTLTVSPLAPTPINP